MKQWKVCSQRTHTMRSKVGKYTLTIEGLQSRIIILFTRLTRTRGTWDGVWAVWLWLPKTSCFSLRGDGWRRWRVCGQWGEAKTCLDGLQAKGCWALFTRAKVHSDQLGQSVPDVVNDTLLDPDLTRALCILHYQTLGSLKLHYLPRSAPPS